MKQMHPEELALLAAIRAEPQDNTPRLVYADWLDEHDQPARAEFIRIQVEAEGHHLDPARRAELNVRAQVLLAEHWTDWWAPVCEAIGWRRPALPRRTRLGRVLRAVGLTPAGAPFVLDPEGRINPPYSPQQRRERPMHIPPLFDWSGFNGAEFRRGFPELIHVCGGGPALGEWGRQWATVSPITSLKLEDLTGAAWDSFDGPHLASVTTCSVTNFTPDGVERFASSQFVRQVENFRLSPAPAGHLRFFSNEWLGRLRSLNVLVAASEDAAALADRPLANLDTLTVEQLPETVASDDYLRRLVTSPHLAGLRELIVAVRPRFRFGEPLSGRPPLQTDGSPIFAGSSLRGLQRLVIRAGVDANAIRSLTHEASLPELEELRFETVDKHGSGRIFNPAGLHVLAAAPLLQQLRRLLIYVNHTGDDVVALADALVPTGLEMLLIETTGISWRWKQAVRDRLGSRVRMIRV